MAAKKLEVVITGSDRGVSKTFGKVSKSADAMGTKLETAGRKIGTAFAYGGAAAAAGLAVMVPQLVDLQGKLVAWEIKADTVFESSAAKVRKWADSVNESFGMTDEEVTGVAASFGDLLKPMGFTADQAATMSMEVVNLSGALSEWTGGTRSAAEVSEILAKAMLGERESLKELGISILDADVQARLAAKGQKQLTGAALEQAKAIATQELIFEKSTDAQKAWAAGGNETLRAGNKLKALWGEMQVWLAERLVPALSKAATWLGEDMPEAIRGLNDWMGRNKPIVLGVAAAIGTTLVAAFVAWAAAAIPAAAATIAATWPLLALVAAVALVAAGLVWAYENVDWFRKAVDKVASFVTGTVIPSLKMLAAAAVVVAGKVRDLWNWISRNLLPILRAVASVVAGQVRAAFSAAATVVSWVSQRVSDLAGRLRGLQPVAAAVAGFFGGSFRSALNGAQAVLNGVRSAASMLASAFQTVINAVARLSSAIRSIPTPKLPKLPSLGSLFGRAKGGPVDAGQPYMVGEKGPELIVPKSAGTVLTASQTSKIVSSGSAAPLTAPASSGSGAVYVVVNVAGSVLTGDDLAAQVRNALIDRGRRTGKPIFAGLA